MFGRYRTGIVSGVAAIAALTCIEVATAPRFTGFARERPPSFFVALESPGGPVGIVRASSVDSCGRGLGLAEFLRAVRRDAVVERRSAAPDWRPVACGDVVPLTARELRRALGLRGYLPGSGAIGQNRWPFARLGGCALVRFSRWSLVLAGDFALVEYHLCWNDESVRLVRWGSGNHWGEEIDHTYSVRLPDRAVATLRSRERGVILDGWGRVASLHRPAPVTQHLEPG